MLLLAFPAVYIAGAAFPPQLVLYILPRYAPPPPDAKSSRGKDMTDGVEREIQDLPIVHSLRHEKDWYETRPYSKYDPDKVHNSLTAGSLRGPGKLAVPPILFAKNDETEATSVSPSGLKALTQRLKRD